MNILDYIPVGEENAVNRERLCALTGLSDRKNRALIERARKEMNKQKSNEAIVNLQDGRGYYLTIDIDALERQYRQMRSRGLSILSGTTPLRRILKAAGRDV